MATTSQRPSNSYESANGQSRSTALNGLNGSRAPGRGEYEDRLRDDLDYSALPTNPPAVPEVPRGPPISYKGPSSRDNDVPQRSFSQRAKGRPFPREAFEDETAQENIAGNEAQARYNGTTEVYEDALAPTHRRQRNDNLQVDTGVQRETSLKQAPKSYWPSQSARPIPPYKLETEPKHVRRASQNLPALEDPMSPPQRSATLREPTNVNSGQRREWAPDRSPLQKLEVTLGDISKEEKRARVEEAEMLLRESKAGGAARRASKEAAPAHKMRHVEHLPSKHEREPTNIEDAGIVRNLSSKQRDRLQHSAQVDSRRPDVKQLSGDGQQGFDYQEQQYTQNRAAPEFEASPVSPRQVQSRKKMDQSQPRIGHESETQRALPGRNEDAPIVKQYDEGQRAAQAKTMVVQEQLEAQHQDRSPHYPPPIGQGQRLADGLRDVSTGNEHFQHQHGPRRSASGRQASNAQNVARAAPTNITRAVSVQQQEPPSVFTDDDEVARVGPAREVNSSHKAALLGASAAGAAAMAAAAPIGRTGSRKLQKTPPKDRTPANSEQDWSKLSDSARQFKRAAPVKQEQDWSQLSDSARQFKNVAARSPQVDHPSTPISPEAESQIQQPKYQHYQRGIPKQVDVQRSSSQRSANPVGLGLQEDTTIEDPPHRHHQSDHHHLPEVLHHHKPRQQSVSFKEPFDRARPVDEWREGGIARLTLADMALDSARNPEQDKAWWEKPGGSAARRRSRRSSGARNLSAEHEAPIDDRHAEFQPPLYLKCGPLLRYTGMRRKKVSQAEAANGAELGMADESETWRGSVLIVTQDSQSSFDIVPTLRLFSQPRDLLPPPPEQVEELAPEYVDPIAGLTKMSRTGKILYVRPVDHLEEGRDLSMIEDENGLFEESPSPLDTNGNSQATTAKSNDRTRGTDGEGVGKYQEIRAVRLYADPIKDVTFWRFNIEVELGERQAHIAYRINKGPAVGFWVPARGQSMNIMFHSCNGFSMSVNPDLFSGPDPLWRDVLNTHQTRPFHVMIGGGDQVYNDRVMVQTQRFAEWTQTRNPHEKHKAPFTPEMREELETFYLNRYAMWFSQGLFGMANSQIPMVNMWDDHDIIDGFGSYPDHFMTSPVFSGLGNVAFKYYMLFQHHSVVEETATEEPSWLLGAKPGPYINHQSRSVFMHMGKHVAFLGLDCRTERRQDEIVTPDTYDIVLERCRREISEGETKHLILLLGIPIAYPRLVWLENVLTSRAMDPIKALGRAGIFKGGFLNKFDGGVEILDDLDDHWTAKNHKHERNDFILDLQDLSAEKSVRITILGGDVHLAAIGQFYSNPKLKVPKDRDHRYMPNVISSAIVNTPPSEMMGDILNKRNKVHHLNHYTVEDMIPMFTHDVDGKRRNNKRLLPRRNWCSIREYHPGSTPPPTPPTSPSASGSEGEEEYEPEPKRPQRRFSFSKEDVDPRNLFRRLSSRRAPPSSYRDDMDFSQNRGSGSFEVSRPNNRFGSAPGSRSASQQRSQFAPEGQPNGRAVSFEQGSNLPGEKPVRPGNFQQRPTNLSSKAARKGVVPGVDKDGKEVEVNDHINLEGGLDIILNCEVSQRDSAGITTPYRLLVPALWYDGSSDREKLDESESVNAMVARRPTLLQRMSLGGKRKKNLADGQGSGNWGKDVSDTPSYSGSDGLEEEQKPKRRFSLFGRRRKNEVYDDDDYEDGAAVRPGSRDQQNQQDYANASQQARDAFRPGSRDQPPQEALGPAQQQQRDAFRPGSREQPHVGALSPAQPQSRETFRPGSRDQPPTAAYGHGQAHSRDVFRPGSRDHQSDEEHVSPTLPKGQTSLRPGSRDQQSEDEYVSPPLQKGQSSFRPSSGDKPNEKNGGSSQQYSQPAVPIRRQEKSQEVSPVSPPQVSPPSASERRRSIEQQYGGGLPPPLKLGIGQPSNKSRFQQDDADFEQQARALGRERSNNQYQYSGNGAQVGSGGSGMYGMEHRGPSQPPPQQHRPVSGSTSTGRPFGNPPLYQGNQGPFQQYAGTLASGPQNANGGRSPTTNAPPYPGPVLGGSKMAQYLTQNPGVLTGPQASQQPGSKAMRLLGVEPQYEGTMARGQPPPSYPRGPPQRSNSANYGQGPQGYSGVDAYKEPKKRRWSLTGGRKWIGDGSLPA